MDQDEIRTEELIDDNVFVENTSGLFVSEGEVSGRAYFGCETIKHPGSVAILAIDERNRCILVKPYHYVLNQAMEEIPAGILNKLQGESPRQGAERELRIATGQTAESWDYLGSMFPSPGIVDEVLYLFLARGLKQVFNDELLKIERVPINDVKKRIALGTITDSKLNSALLLANLQDRL